jgi:hypothetical protein
MTARRYPPYGVYTKVYLNLFVFFKKSCFNCHNIACHRHGDTYLYRIMSIKIRPLRVTGYMPASGHWRFRGTMTPSRVEQAAPLAAGHPATTWD